MENYFAVTGCWGARPDDTDELARRLARYLASLVPIASLFGHWKRSGMRYRSAVPSSVTLPPSLSELRDWLDENPCFVARNGRKAHIGYSISAGTAREERPYAHLWLHSALAEPQGYLANRTGLSLLTPETDPRSLRQAARPMLLALATAWDASWAGVAAGDFGEQPSKAGLTYQSGWMIYLDREHASRIAEPDDIKVEMLPSGAILLTATDAIFDSRSEAHRTAARRLQAALAPLNAGTAQRPVAAS